MSKLSRDFHLDEFECHDGTPVPTPALPALVRLVEGVLQPLRYRWAAPLYIVSGYRTPSWNLRVGGASSSTHLFENGWAGVDVRAAHLREVPHLHAMALYLHTTGQLPELGGLGEYPRWVHLDTRKLSSGRLRRWKGGGMGAEPPGES